MGRTRASFASRWTSTRTQHHKHKAPCCVVALVDICELQAIEVPSLRIGLGACGISCGQGTQGAAAGDRTSRVRRASLSMSFHAACKSPTGWSSAGGLRSPRIREISLPTVGREPINSPLAVSSTEKNSNTSCGWQHSIKFSAQDDVRRNELHAIRSQRMTPDSSYPFHIMALQPRAVSSHVLSEQLLRTAVCWWAAVVAVAVAATQAHCVPLACRAPCNALVGLVQTVADARRRPGAETTATATAASTASATSYAATPPSHPAVWGGATSLLAEQHSGVHLPHICNLGRAHTSTSSCGFRRHSVAAAVAIAGTSGRWRGFPTHQTKRCEQRLFMAATCLAESSRRRNPCLNLQGLLQIESRIDSRLAK